MWAPFDDPNYSPFLKCQKWLEGQIPLLNSSNILKNLGKNLETLDNINVIDRFHVPKTPVCFSQFFKFVFGSENQGLICLSDEGDPTFSCWIITDCENFVKQSGPLDLHFWNLWAPFSRSKSLTLFKVQKWPS